MHVYALVGLKSNRIGLLIVELRPLEFSIVSLIKRLHVHGQEVVPVRDLTPAAGTQGRLLRAHGGHCLEGGWRKSTIKIKPDTPCKTTTRGL